ncbi:DNA-formamidopyrimidine glycosylase [Candidatus Phytoplasma pini]|uniref:Formamidopyrimidine-DNA glycosylase n=1 Tax=Candidatus Phytoplasma pini TaxID=267362 RepID=A0A559KJF8_9MOLU|nr:DNA-formamidopyrimidine glycosylase [Candidatus Phytoplasma pini]TVY12266.1 Formamidopyrimidine-DNA glycosylase [Candidatus Phytoplasma pini]
MPELPEVEVIIRKLRKKIINCCVKKIDIFYNNIIKNIDFFYQIVDKVFLDIQRKGKFLLFFLSDDLVLVGHLRMEGKIYLNSHEECRFRHLHEHFRIHLDNGLILRYYDFRKFGRFAIYYRKNYLEESKLYQLAPDPFEISLEMFYQKIKKKSTSIKTVLLDQKIISGIGNIYASEILFLSKIHPEISVNTLSKEKILVLLNKTREVLIKAINLGGTSISSFEALGQKGSYQKELLVYRKANEPCCFCQKNIQKKKISGRSTYFCIQCQK